jgi:hypothetical protein
MWFRRALSRKIERICASEMRPRWAAPEQAMSVVGVNPGMRPDVDRTQGLVEWTKLDSCAATAAKRRQGWAERT